MNFITDKQTLDELNILGKFRQGSIYNLFNRVKTRGGEQLLNKMFQYPLTNVSDINDRSSIFQFFQRSNLVFPFDVQQLTLMREYLDTSASQNTFISIVSTMCKKWLSSITRDERYKKNLQGLHATIITINKCFAFVHAIPSGNNPYSEKIHQVKNILVDPHFENLRNIDIYRSLPVKTLGFYNYMLKKKLRNEMELILSFIHEIDVFISVSTVAKVKGFSYAKALPPEHNTLSATGLCHPCIEGATGNTLLLNADNNVLFLTGANMAGKSTLMKSIGINLYLAHMAFPVAASQMEFSVREGLYTSINVADNIGLGYSHFYAEVVRVKQAAEAAASGKRLLLMFDELFKGTNVKDAYDGTLAVTEGFLNYNKCLFVVSTHIIEVGEALKNQKNIHFVYMPTIMDGPYPRYTYQLQEGITVDRQGMMIIKNEGILELLSN